jgi:hypothetical protein
MIILDESQKIKNRSTEAAKALRKLGAVCKYKMILTGTPVTQSPADFFSQYRFLKAADGSVAANWVADFKQSYPIAAAPYVGGVYRSFDTVAHNNQYVAIARDSGMAAWGNICISFAANPWGPFTTWTKVYGVGEGGPGYYTDGIWWYSTFGHPEISAANEILGQPISYAVLHGHRNVIMDVAFAPDSSAVYTASNDGDVLKSVAGSSEYLNNPVIQSFAGIAGDISGAFNNLQDFGSVNGKNFLVMGEITSTGVVSNAVNRVTVKGEDPTKVAAEANAEIEALLK